MLFALFFFILGISHGVIFPVGAMILADNISRKLLAIANALYTTSWDTGSTLGPIVTAPLVAQYTYREANYFCFYTPNIDIDLDNDTSEKN